MTKDKIGKQRRPSPGKTRDVIQDTQEFSSRLRRAATKLDLEFSDSQINAWLTYVEQIDRWNRVYNLTAIRDREQMLIQHIFDSLAVVPIVREVLYKKTVSGCTIVDVGSGAGLPGVVLAIAAPWTVHCIDAVQKKMAFVQQMAGKLQLPNLNAHHGRVEELESLDADVVISRAFSSLADFTHLAGRHMASDGCLLAMKGRRPDDEIEMLNETGEWRVDAVHTLSVPELDAQRCVLRLTRQG